MIGNDFDYVPTLAIRPSEMNGLQHLPGLAKQYMRPVFLVAPWTTANSLEKGVERAEKAYPEYRYYLDLDRDYSLTNPELDAQGQLLELFSSSDGYGKWWQFVEKFERAVPCLQLRDQTREDLAKQVDRAQELGRGFCIRVVLARFPENISDVVHILNRIGTADYIVVLEGGWTEDALSFAGTMSGLIGGVFGDVGAQVPIVVSCTSMPKEFHNFRGCEILSFTNRELVAQIARDYNRRRIVYGDWGSTRPREAPSHKQRPFDRIDYPTKEEWVIARNREEGWGFTESANAVVYRSGRWDAELRSWGSNMILQTLKNPKFGINTPQKNVASRVNIHLHRQAFYHEDMKNMDFDDPWED